MTEFIFIIFGWSIPLTECNSFKNFELWRNCCFTVTTINTLSDYDVLAT